MSKHLKRTKEFGTIPLLSLQVIFSAIVPRSELPGCCVELITTAVSQLPKKLGLKHQLYRNVIPPKKQLIIIKQSFDGGV